jgi:LmbE family N-acetylglucosaminyl deacetylase
MPGLVLAGAHPDDELYAAGLLVRLADLGVETHLLCLTRGEGGTAGDPPVAAREDLGAAREAELRASAATLRLRSVELLGYVDPMPQGRPLAPEVDPDHLASQIAEALRQRGAEAVLTHGSNGEYGHPAHRLMHQAVMRAVEILGDEAPVLYTFNAFAPGVSLWGGENRDDPADLIFDPTPWLQVKARAFACHVSQRRGIWFRPDGPATEIEYLREQDFRETFRRHGHGSDPLRSWLEARP